MSSPLIDVTVDHRGVANVRLNRPERNNAYNGEMITTMLDTVRTARSDDSIRVVVLTGAGRHFQAGADLAWIQSVRTANPQVNREVSANTANVVRELNELPKPVVALVQGACFGGGTGIIAACDVVIASENALFSVTEARWGLNASIIVPVLSAAIGASHARRYALTAERFDARRAAAIGLVHEVVAAEQLSQAGESVVDALLHVAPGALATMKKDFLNASASIVTDEQFERLIDQHAEGRQLDEAEEGLASFFAKRKPRWYR